MPSVVAVGGYLRQFADAGASGVAPVISRFRARGPRVVITTLGGTTPARSISRHDTPRGSMSELVTHARGANNRVQLRAWAQTKIAWAVTLQLDALQAFSVTVLTRSTRSWPPSSSASASTLATRRPVALITSNALGHLGSCHVRSDAVAVKPHRPPASTGGATHVEQAGTRSRGVCGHRTTQESLLVDGSVLLTAKVDRTTDFEHGTPGAK